MHDYVQTLPDARPGAALARYADRVVRHLLSRVGAVQGGSWIGNDTCWRMVLDLATIARYADRDGMIRETQQRENVVLIDGVVAGEGIGPLNPNPVPSGTILFSDDPVTADVAAARWMGFDPMAIPLIANALSDSRWGPYVTSEVTGWMNGQIIQFERLWGPRRFVPPRGWESIAYTLAASPFPLETLR
jgi:hypothetical protein